MARTAGEVAAPLFYGLLTGWLEPSETLCGGVLCVDVCGNLSPIRALAFLAGLMVVIFPEGDGAQCSDFCVLEDWKRSF